MGHIGNTVQTAFTSFDKQTITGTGGTTYTLTHSVANEQEIEVFVNNVRQEPSVAYNVSGNTLTMTGNVASTDDFYVVFQGKAVQTVTHPSDAPLQATTGTFSGALTATAGASSNAISLQSANFKMTDLTSNAFYRTGTWTPVASSSGATTTGATIHTGTPQIQQGYYVRIGDFVSVHWTYKFPSTSFSYTNGAAGSDQLRFHGLPFKIHAQSHFYPIATCGYFSSWSGWPSGFTPMAYGQTNSNEVRCVNATTNGVASLSLSYHSAANAQSIWSLHYITDDA